MVERGFGKEADDEDDANGEEEGGDGEILEGELELRDGGQDWVGGVFVHHGLEEGVDDEEGTDEAGGDGAGEEEEFDANKEGADDEDDHVFMAGESGYVVTEEEDGGEDDGENAEDAEARGFKFDVAAEHGTGYEEGGKFDDETGEGLEAGEFDGGDLRMIRVDGGDDGVQVVFGAGAEEVLGWVAVFGFGFQVGEGEDFALGDEFFAANDETLVFVNHGIEDYVIVALALGVGADEAADGRGHLFLHDTGHFLGTTAARGHHDGCGGANDGAGGHVDGVGGGGDECACGEGFVVDVGVELVLVGKFV